MSPSEGTARTPGVGLRALACGRIPKFRQITLSGGDPAPMLRIRLRRVGKKKQPSYRIVVADVRAPRDGAIVEQVGIYNPLTDPPTIRVDAEKVKHWISVGAQPSDTVVRILQREGVVGKPEPSAVAEKAEEPAGAEETADPAEAEKTEA
jgi:small subunit ribosomal protein S16